MLFGSAALISAPAFSRTRAQSTHPCRAANRSGVNPPSGIHFSRGSLVTCRSQFHVTCRAFTSAPCAINSCAISGCDSATAHISAVCCRHCSLELTSAPCASSTLAASTLPVRATVISAVSPSLLAALASAPASSSFAIIGALPFTHARYNGVTPYRFAAFTFAPALISRSAISRSSWRTAQCKAVVPSGSGTFTSARFSSAMAPGRSPSLTASANLESTPSVPALANKPIPNSSSPKNPGRISSEWPDPT